MVRAFRPSFRTCGRLQPASLVWNVAVAGKQIQNPRFDVPGSTPLNAERAERLEEPLLEELVIEALRTLSDVRPQRSRRLRRQSVVEVVPHVKDDLPALGSR